MAGATSTDKRPLSPHLSVWRWHVTMAGSILHRATGIALYGATILFVAWLLAVAAGPEAYAPIDALLTSWFGQLCIYLVAAALAYHFANGLRHLWMDTGAGFDLKQANATAWFSILFGIAAPLVLWAVLNLGG
jgi:succinate dehydrogenase / fumarate reductase, cytochrome b subunit